MVMHESRGLSTASAERLKPPVAARVPKAVKFGVVAGEDRGVEPMDPPATLVDNYFWLRDDSRTDETILAHLRAENAFTEAATGHLAAFRAKLYDELLSRVQEDDDTPPYKLGDWLYFSRTVGGGPDELYLDVNEVAKTLPNPKQCDVHEVEVSPDGSQVAFAVDGTGYETYDVADDALVFEEPDEMFNVGCWRDADGSTIFIESESKETTELRFISLEDGGGAPTVVRPREFGVRYDAASHAPSNSLILTSNVDGFRNRALFKASKDAPGTWALLSDGAGAAVLPHDESRSLGAPRAFKDFVAVRGREDGFTQIWTVPLDGAVAAAPATRVKFDADAFTASLGANAEFDNGGVLRVRYGSVTTPSSTLDYDVASTAFTTVKVQPVPNYDEALYATERVEVPSRDGTTKIPVTLLWRKDKRVAGEPMPTHLYGYGSYGICMDPSFSSSRFALVDRGICYAIAHVRGGGEMGHNLWYEQQGKYLAKKNTFFDFVDVAAHLKATGVASEMSCEGRSAGGLLVGNAVNLAPDAFCACVAGVPFVDLMVTMCDPSIPLTTEEWEEWGNPNNAKYFQYMLEYSPIDNVAPGVTYPKMLLVSGLNDPRVAYWEPAKWAQVLRHDVANPDDVLLKMDMAAGHFSAADRYRYLRELAFDYAWLLDVFGKAE
ncbi:serine-type exopeptidase [Aureococcus anophagefferens]|nr:serine-type exopeptidase [Aureococcus anophagefferens]